MNSCLKNIYPLSKFQRPETALPGWRFRISSNNLFIELGRYETPIIPRGNKWCLHCYFTTGVKTLEDEIHALAKCSCTMWSGANLSIRYPTNLSPPHGLLPLLKLYMPYYLSTKSMSNTTKVPTSITTVVAVSYFNIYPT